MSIDPCIVQCYECGELGDIDEVRCPYCGEKWWKNKSTYICWGTIRPTESYVTIKNTKQYVINRGVVQIEGMHTERFPTNFMGGKNNRIRSPFKKRNTVQGVHHGNSKSKKI